MAYSISTDGMGQSLNPALKMKREIDGGILSDQGRSSGPHGHLRHLASRVFLALQFGTEMDC